MAKELFTEDKRKEIQKAIAEAEKNTSGEIRLYVENNCKGDVLDRAAFIFGELEMHKTKERNGVLFYLATESKKFAVIGDAGIHAKVPVDFWNHIKEEMKKHFTTGDFVSGLSKGIRMSGKALQQHFPFKTGDTNELSNEIVFGKD